jgi:hypothetical protein
MNIQKRIESLQPYVLQFRFLNGVSIVDAVFKNGWKVPDSQLIQAVKGEDSESNYYMIYTEREDLGIDDVLDFIERVIEINIEREKKYELLKVKTEELKELFRKTPLSKLQDMKFVLGNEKLVPDTMPDDFDEIKIDDVDDSTIEDLSKEEIDETIDDSSIEEEDKEDLDGASNVEANTNNPVIERVGNQEIELPPKGEKIVVEEYKEPTVICKCGPDEMCPVCIEEKMDA